MMNGIADPAEEYFKDGIWGWDATAGIWVKLPVDDEGRLRVVVGGGDYVCIRDRKARNTAGGDFLQDAWRDRTINDEQADAAGICTIADPDFTLAAGTYRCAISSPALNVNSHQLRLMNQSTMARLLIGTTEFAVGGVNGSNRSFIVGRFTLAAANVLLIQHYCSVTQLGIGFGAACNFTDELYTIAEFWREPG